MKQQLSQNASSVAWQPPFQSRATRLKVNAPLPASWCSSKACTSCRASSTSWGSGLKASCAFGTWEEQCGRRGHKCMRHTHTHTHVWGPSASGPQRAWFPNPKPAAARLHGGDLGGVDDLLARHAYGPPLQRLGLQPVAVLVIYLLQRKCENRSEWTCAALEAQQATCTHALHEQRSEGQQLRAASRRRPHVNLVYGLQAKRASVQHHPPPGKQGVICRPRGLGNQHQMHQRPPAPTAVLLPLFAAPACCRKPAACCACHSLPSRAAALRQQAGCARLCLAAASALGWLAGRPPPVCKLPAAARLCGPGTPRRPACRAQQGWSRPAWRSERARGRSGMQCGDTAARRQTWRRTVGSAAPCRSHTC